MNKKGSILDLMYIGFVLLFFGIVVLVGLKMGGSFRDQIAGMADMPAESKDAANTLMGGYTNTIDNSFLIFTIFLALATLVLAALVRVHPIFIPFYFIGWVFVIFLCGIFSNLYQSMAADPNLATEAAQLVFIGAILTYLPLIVGVVGMLLMVVMYKLWSVSQE